MSISSRITEMEQHIGNAYDKIEDLGIDLTDVDKNINNISAMLENVWNEYPKVSATDVEEASLNGTKKGRMEIDLKGNTEQEQLKGVNLTEHDEITFPLSNDVLCDFGDGRTFSKLSFTLICNNNAYSQPTAAFILYEDENDTEKYMTLRNAFQVPSSPANGTFTYSISNVTVKRIRLINWSVMTGSIKLQIQEGEPTAWEPYTNGLETPNPNYIEPIKNVTGNANVKIQNKNLLNINRELGEPSNTDFANTTKRFFNYNTYVKGITGANNYSSSAVKDVVIEDNNVSFTTVNGYYGLGFPIKVKPNTNYYFSVTELSANSLVRIMFYDKDGTYLSNVNKGSFTTPSNCDCILVFLTGSQANTTYNFTNLQIEQGSTATSYVEHQEQNYPFSLKSKNLVDIPDITLNSSGYIYNGNIDLKAGTYTLSMGQSSQASFSIAIIGESGTLVSGSITLPYTFTIDEKATSMRLYSPGAGTFKNIMIEEGSTATDYEPYYDIKAMEGTTLEDDGIHQKRKQFVLTEEKINQLYPSLSTFYNIQCISIDKRNLGWKVSWNSGICLIDRYKEMKNISSIASGQFATNLQQYNLNIFDDRFTDLATAKELLVGTIIEIEQAKEEIIPYNATQQAQYNAIKQARSYDDQTNISSTSDELGFKMDVESLSNGVSSSNTRTLALGSLNKGSLNNIKEVDTEDTEVAQDAEDETSVESEE